MSIKITTQAPQGTAPDARRPRSEVPARLRIAAILLYAIFIRILLAVTMRVSSPQSESIWSVYETPGDLIRLRIGIRRLPVDPLPSFHASRMLKDIGRRDISFVVPFALALAFAVR